MIRERILAFAVGWDMRQSRATRFLIWFALVDIVGVILILGKPGFGLALLSVAALCAFYVGRDSEAAPKPDASRDRRIKFLGDMGVKQ